MLSEIEKIRQERAFNFYEKDPYLLNRVFGKKVKDMEDLRRLSGIWADLNERQRKNIVFKICSENILLIASLCLVGTKTAMGAFNSSDFNSLVDILNGEDLTIYDHD